MIDIFDDLEFEPHTLYHVSPKQFDFPCRQKIFEAREWSRWHDNGVLGLWCSTRPATCAGFGAHVYEVALHPEAKIIGLSLCQFQRLTSDMEDFTDLIAYLCAKGDVAYIVDGWDKVGEVIILNFDCIDAFREVSKEGLKDIEVALYSSDIRSRFR